VDSTPKVEYREWAELIRRYGNRWLVSRGSSLEGTLRGCLVGAAKIPSCLKP